MLLIGSGAIAQEEKADTMKFTFGSKKVIVIDTGEDDSEEELEDTGDIDPEWDEDDDDDKKKKKDRGAYKNSYVWGGLGIGVTGYLSPDNTIGLPAGMELMELDYSRSVGANLNFLDKRIDIARHGLGLVTGLGLDFRSYAFKNNTAFAINKDTIAAFGDSLVTFDKNKLKSVYVQVPLLIDINTSADPNKAVHIGFGVIGGIRLTSKLKQIYEVEGDRTKVRTRGHFQMNPFSADLTARVGYGDLVFYGNYGLMSVFEGGKGTDLTPFTIGVLVNI